MLLDEPQLLGHCQFGCRQGVGFIPMHFAIDCHVVVHN